ncbi:MAG: calcium/proton exchanger [Candidatus Roseilinea sp.]|nr:MAG: calcium/proton exchanger [Candidatus Roseilinea sp.]
MQTIIRPFLKPLNALLLMIPVAIVAELAGWSPVLVFLTAALAVVPLAGLMGDATEELAARTGPQIGALINATLGNAAELIITILAIRQGLLDLVRASIVGSIIGNILLVLGAAFLIGGLKHGIQKFTPSQAGLNATMLLVSAVVLTVPAFFAFAIEPDTQRVEELSLLTAAVIIVMYVLSVIYTLRARAGDPLTREAAHAPTMSLPLAIGLLVVATALIALVSEFLVGAVEPMTAQLGISEVFVGIILVPVIGNIAEHVVAIEVAAKDQMDLSLGIAIGSSLQVALLVAPVLVFVALLFGQYLTLEFTAFELVALLASCLIAAAVSMDGRSNWLEGALLIGLYLIVGIAFFFLPTSPG